MGLSSFSLLLDGLSSVDSCFLLEVFSSFPSSLPLEVVSSFSSLPYRALLHTGVLVAALPISCRKSKDLGAASGEAVLRRFRFSSALLVSIAVSVSALLVSVSETCSVSDAGLC